MLKPNGSFMYRSEKNQVNSTQIFPNPVEKTLHISIPNKLNIQSLQIFNLTGSIVISERDFAKKTINVQNLPSGIYLLNLQTNEGIEIHKFVKQ